MTDDKDLAFALLQSLNYAVLKRTAPKEYVFFGNPPPFYENLFPSADDSPCTAPWEKSAMLEFFFTDAEEFFATGQLGMFGSGFWEEAGLTEENTALRSAAINLGETQVIIIREIRDEYADRLEILRKAREKLRENRELATNLSIFKEKSRIDGLTSIFNKATFAELLLDEIKRSTIMDYPLVLIVLDIDDFKRVNDTYGHLIGDRILQAMGGVLKKTLRRSDVVARNGGEEFAVLITQVPLLDATQIAEKIRSNIASMDVLEAPPVTVSLGCSQYYPEESADDFFKRADEALYVAKKEGKNRVCVK